MTKPCLLLTNDDGIEALGLHALIRALHERDFPIVVIAPATEQSATSMRLSLGSNLRFEEREDIAGTISNPEGPPLRMFSLDGSPCDCVIVAIDGGLDHWVPEMKPALCVSGINQGPNLSVDVMHSGTVSAARESGLYGLPSIATSLCTYEHSNFEDTANATADVIEAAVAMLPPVAENMLRPNGSTKPITREDTSEQILSEFKQGNLMLNINAPKSWTNGFQTVSLGARWYHNAIGLTNSERKGIAYGFRAAQIVDEDIPNTDCNAVNSGAVAITPLSCWPVNHPLGIPQDLLEKATNSGSNGLPFWLEI
ncbi:MAG: 5'/3'-nucleotidase SurE [Candidatus Thalassarchaeaceae archaeon]